MLLYRIARRPYAKDLSGEGARIYGARWNSLGVPIVYLAGSRSLAVLEVLVHINPAAIPDDFMMATFYAPDEVSEINIHKLPKDWNNVYPPVTLQSFGDNFVAENKHLLLKVPSAVIPKESNYLLNPKHRKIAEVKLMNLDAFSFDERLM